MLMYIVFVDLGGLVAKGDVRARMVATAARLLAEQGPTGASFGDVLKTSGAARGSTYHHFPRGKREMYDAALDLASQHVYSVLDDVRGQSATVIVEKYFAMWRNILTRSELRLGCAILAVAVAGEDQQNVSYSGTLFRDFRGHLSALFAEGGLGDGHAQALAATTLAAVEGAVAIARAEQSISVFDLVAAQVADLAARMTNESRRLL